MPCFISLRAVARTATLLALLLSACSDSNRPEQPEEQPRQPSGWIRGTVESIAGLEAVRSELRVFSAVDSSTIDADGRFLVAVDSLASSLWLAVARPGGPPILLAAASPSGGDVSIGALETVRALLALDPLLHGVPDSYRGVLAEGLESALQGPAAELRRRIDKGRFDTLVDAVDPEIQREIARALRERIGPGPSEPGGEAPWIVAAAAGARQIDVANPLAVHLGISVHPYFSEERLLTSAVGRAELETPLIADAPGRSSTSLPAGRYRLSFHTGLGSPRDSRDAPEALAADRNLWEMLRHATEELLRVAEPLAWMENPVSFSSSGLAGIEAVRAALAEGDPIAYRGAVLELLSRNLDELLPGVRATMPRLLLPVAIACNRGAAEMDPGLHLHQLFTLPQRIDRHARIDPDGVAEIDPPELVRAPEQLAALYRRGAVHLHWKDRANNEDGYIVERRMDGFFSQRASLTADANGFQDSDLRPDWVYTYRVYAYNQVAASPRSIELPIETREIEDTVPPGVVTDLRAGRTSFDSVELIWTAPGDDGFLGRAHRYEIRHAPYWITEGTWDEAALHPAAPAVLPAGSIQRVTMYGLAPGAEYWIAMRTYDRAGQRSPVSNMVHVVTDSERPDDRWLHGFAPYPEGKGMNGGVFALVTYGGDLIAGGNFTYAGGVRANHVARWDGSAWHPLGQGTDGYVRCLAVHDGDLVAGGYFRSAGDQTVNGIARWDGTSWHPIGAGTDGAVFAVCEHNGDLIAGGNFDRMDAAPARSIARYDGSAWHPLGGGVNNQVFTLRSLQGDLLVGGDFGLAGDVPGTSQIARWDGSAWHSVGGGMNLDYVFAMEVFSGELFAGGQFLHAGGVPARNLARFNGVSWDPLGTGADRWVRSMKSHRQQLFVGGEFWNVDDHLVWHIARWDGATWRDLGSGTDSYVSCMEIHDSKLVIGGWFTRAGGKPSRGIAFWKL